MIQLIVVIHLYSTQRITVNSCPELLSRSGIHSLLSLHPVQPEGVFYHASYPRKWHPGLRVNSEIALSNLLD